ncbi:MAG: hypothetical protein V3V02_03650 [Rhizobiaceae bacterium]
MFNFFTSEVAGFSAETANLIATGLIALIALVLLYMLYRLIRRPRLASGRRSKQARLAITDAALIDERRKLVLVRRDDVEHLVLIGGASDLVIENNIRRNTPARPLTAPSVAGRATAPVAKPAPAPTSTPVKAPAVSEPTAPALSAPPPIPPIPPVTTTAAPAVASVGAGLAAAAVGTAAIASGVADQAKEAVSDTVEAVKDKVKDSAPEVKTTTAVEDMDALLSEITVD